MSTPKYVAGKGEVPYDECIIGHMFFYKDKLVRAYRLQGGDNQVAVMNIETGRHKGYPSVIDLLPAVLPGKEEYAFPQTSNNILASRCVKLETQVSVLTTQVTVLTTQYQDLLDKYTKLLQKADDKLSTRHPTK